ncbi:conserved hypothetical protein [delta proteobacterium NaphS2]|nr:conserved hypothetical protein [delta proteobacterium NaphS2]
MTNIRDILNGPEYFFCEKTNCRLRIAVCIQRQEANKKTRAFAEAPFMVCEDCPQGIKNRSVQPKGGLKLTEEKKENLPAPVDEKRQTEKTEDAPPVRLCECGKPTISPNTPFCPSCMGKMPNKKRQAKTPERVSLPLSPTAIIVEFKNHPDILERVTREAKEQIRTVSGQVIWTLKNAVPPPGKRSHHVQDL